MCANLPRGPCVSVLTLMRRTCSSSLQIVGGLVVGELVVCEFVRQRDLEKKTDETMVSDAGRQGMHADSPRTSE